jgi:hypothetical protein
MKAILCRTCGPASATRERQLAEIKILRLAQAPVGWLFWLIEQRIARIEDKLSREKCCQ